MLNDEQKRELVESCGVTLDGKPAHVVGVKERFATVRQLASPHVEAQWSWAAVERVVREHGAAFRSN